VRDPLLDDLDPQQRAAVVASHPLLAIIAPAGSGKTRVLTRRAAYRIREHAAETKHVLALTFTRKAAAELTRRLRRLGVDGSLTGGTFHAVALAQLRRQATERGWEQPRVLDRKGRLLGPLLGGRGPAASVGVNEIAAEIEWAKARLLTPDEFVDAARAESRRLPRPGAEIAELYARYETEKRKRRLLDFDDVLHRCADGIARNDEFAAGQRWRFRHFFVDEFQDATPLQVRLLRAWLGHGRDLSVVGDPAQAIYGFAGADASPLGEFAQVFGGETVALAHNYRSTPAVVAIAEVGLGAAAHSARRPPRAVRPDGDRPTIVAYDTGEVEAAAIADRCWRSFTAGVPWQGMAVLFRTNAQSSLFEAAFTRRGVPFRVTEGQRFAARPAVRALIDRLRDAERSAPSCRFAEHLADLAADDPDHDEETRAHRNALVDLAREYLAAVGGFGSVAGFVGWLDASTQGEDAHGTGVDLATFHRAKGLEWPVVFVAGLEQGLVPVSWATSDASLHEERRLFHVALSRAQDELHCSWACARSVGARRSAREPSPWLGMLEDALHTIPGSPPNPARYVTALRDTLAAASPAEPTSHAARRHLRSVDGGVTRDEDEDAATLKRRY
jgi:DNA helicase-2/ATP-dependent DNA helicase PcrA